MKKIFKDPILATVEGDWKTGKTDFALFISEVLLENSVVEEVASNIHTEDHYPQISDTPNLKVWLNSSKKSKLFIFDELNENVGSRRAMSSKSVDIISILPEISKAKARIIGLAQDLSGVDSTFRKRVWAKAYFQKFITSESKVKNVRVFAPSFLKNRYEFFDVPRTTIPFDPYLIAPFLEKPNVKTAYYDVNITRFANWVKGMSWKDNGFKHPQEANRFYISVAERLLTIYSQFTQNSVEGILGGETVNDNT